MSPIEPAFGTRPTMNGPNGEQLGFRAKGFPLIGAASSIAEVRSRRLHVLEAGFVTPVATLRASAIENNLLRMAEFCANANVRLAPHGKTTMSPEIFRAQLDHGAWGITFATPWQVKVGHTFGVKNFLLANEVVDPAALEWFAKEILPDAGVTLLSYVDDASVVARGGEILRRFCATRPLDVLLEIGYAGGRTGVRDIQGVRSVGSAVAASAQHRLVGVAGYEGRLGSVATDSVLADVRTHLRQLRTAAEVLDASDLFSAETVVISAGGSAFFDIVVEELGGHLPSGRAIELILRSGSTITHDDGLYGAVTPFRRRPELGRLAGGVLEEAVSIWSRALSRPEPNLAILDVGKRDVPHDAGLPTITRVFRHNRTSGHSRGECRDLGADLSGWEIFDTNDQHAFVRIPESAALAAGDLVVLSISHPCTFFDKWRFIPVIDDEGFVIDVIQTFF